MNNSRTDVLKVILEIAQSIKHRGLMLNERYLHHFFSHILQKKYNTLNLSGDNGKITLHPEWPTYKKQTNLNYGRYRKVNGKYNPDENGTAGFIDFAIGEYSKPDIGIEFSLKYGWSHEEIVYDFFKLLDNKNPFNVSISLNIIFRKGKLPNGGRLENLEEHMNNAYIEAAKRLNKNDCDSSREIHFIITEIDKNDNRRHWYYDRTNNGFKEGLPVLA